MTCKLKNYLNKIKNRLNLIEIMIQIGLVASISLFHSYTYGQELSTDPDMEIIVRFKPGNLNPPITRTYGTPAEFNIPSDLLRTAISRSRAIKLTQLIEGFQPEDRFRTDRFGQVQELTDWTDVYVIQLPAASGRDSLMELLKSMPDVVYAEPNAMGKPLFDPDDEHFFRQWSLKNTGRSEQGDGIEGADIKATDAWDITTGSSTIKVALIDKGMQTDHPDFTGRVIGDAGNNFWHGTAVAGVLAAQGDNLMGIAGVAWNVGLINEDIGLFTRANAVIAMNNVINSGAHIVNNSWGLDFTSNAMEQVYNDAYMMNITSVAAMGNDGDDSFPQTPALFGRVILAVGATTNEDVKADYSSTGSWIDVVAPGGEGKDAADEDNIYSTLPDDLYGYKFFDGTKWRKLWGTSFAAPIVSGIAALLYSINPNLYNDDVMEIIKRSAVDKGPAGFDEEYGYGRVDARAALDMIRFPNILTQLTANGGGSTLETPNWYTQDFQDVQDLQGVYWVKRYKVTKSITFPNQYITNPDVWGRGVSTTGFSTDPKWGLGWNGPVSGTITNSGATLKTFIYEVRDICLGEPVECDFLGWFPTTAGNVQYAYTVVGELEGSQTGTIPANTTWTNDVVLYGDVTLSGTNTVNPGVRMEILPGATLKFNNGAKFKIMGQLIAEGTPSNLITFQSVNATPQPGDWGSIDLDFRDNVIQAPSSIKYCHFKDANIGVLGRHANNAVVQYNTFENSNIGPYAWYTNPNTTDRMQILNNTIHDNVKHGIYNYHSDPIIKDNTVSDVGIPNSGLGFGIYLRHANADLGGNIVTGSAYEGIMASGSAAIPKLYYNSTSSPDGGGNTITSNSGHGVYATSSAAPLMGWTTNTPGNNIIYNNVGKEVYNNTPSAIIANCNDWNGTPLITEFFGLVYYDPWIGTNGACDQYGALPDNPFFNFMYAMLDVIPSYLYAQSSDISTRNEQATKKLASGNYGEALRQYKEIIRDHPNSEEVYYALTLSSEAYKGLGRRSEIRPYLAEILNQKADTKVKRFAKRLMMHEMEGAGDFSEALAIGDEILSDNPSDEEINEVLFRQGMIHAWLDESTLASQKFNEIIARFPGTVDALFAAEQNEYFGEEAGFGKKAFGSRSGDISLPREYSLSNNYPNPFNPVTKIEFALPEAGLTRLIIYDLRGREVAILIDGEMSAGIHNVTWDASKVASGIYIYRLTSGNFVNTKKMVLLK